MQLTSCHMVSLALADVTVLGGCRADQVSESLAGQWVYGHGLYLGITYLQYLHQCLLLHLGTHGTVERQGAPSPPSRVRTQAVILSRVN